MEGWGKVALEGRREVQRLEKKNLQLIRKMDEVLAVLLAHTHLFQGAYKDSVAMATSREENDRKRFKKLKLLKASLGDAQQSLRSVGDSPEDLAYCQNLLESLEGKFSLFKASMSQEFDSLMKEEDTLERELSVLASRVESWITESEPFLSRNLATTAAAQVNEHQRQRNEKLTQQRVEIGLIDRKLSALGSKSCGGWDGRDHDAFLRSWAQSGILFIPVSSNNFSCLDQPSLSDSPSAPSHISQIPPKQLHALRKRLTPLLPGMSAETIDQHIEWYLEVQYLLNTKKALLNSWRQEKKLTEEDSESTSVACSQKTGPGSDSGDGDKQEKRRLETKRRLMNWQKQKEEERREAELEEKKKAEEDRRFQEKELLERQQTNRMRLQNWREDREKQKELTGTPPTPPPRPKSADPDLIRRRRHQDLERAKDRRQKAQEARSGLTARYERQQELGKAASLSVVGEHVESKLHSSTKASISQRMTAEELDAAEIRRQSKGAHERKVAYGGYDLKFSGRAIPAWTRPP